MGEELIREYVGSRCMVFSDNNQFLFLGELSHYDGVNRTIRVTRHSDYDGVRFVKPGDAVKLRIKQAGDRPRFLLVDGTVIQSIQAYFYLIIRSVVEKEEEREYFRQSVMQKSEVDLVNGKPAGHPCLIADISAAGIGIHSNQEYQVGDRLFLYNQTLCPGGRSHNLEFRIVRMGKLEGSRYRYFYGCQFINLSTGAQDRLFRDIFTLQASHLHAGREK